MSSLFYYQFGFHVVENVFFSFVRHSIFARRAPRGAEHHERLRPPLLWLQAVCRTFRRDGERESVGAEQPVDSGAVALVETQPSQQQIGR